MTGSTLGLDLGLDKLESSYYEHVAKGVLGNAVNIVKDQYSEGGGDPAYQLNQLTQFAWNLGPGGVIETAGDAAFDVVSKLPIVGDYYSDTVSYTHLDVYKRQVSALPAYPGAAAARADHPFFGSGTWRIDRRA